MAVINTRFEITACKAFAIENGPKTVLPVRASQLYLLLRFHLFEINKAQRRTITEQAIHEPDMKPIIKYFIFPPTAQYFNLLKHCVEKEYKKTYLHKLKVDAKTL